ncbi:hypothetical protein [Billgrantia ethanolica]|uniref:Uncharacterized protein n=1 Tax=Billgrantia ethanolica TaxID=2733486 RepID=A0ABS9A8Y1_9GAMM|nr:hypothetical protein [Halomonas ethanolica]MCE8005277.1 hypothetical protein [Halomonas ethanolica]
MRTFDMTMLAEDSGFTGQVRLSNNLICDSMFASEECVDRFGVRAVGRLELMLKDAARQLSQYPKGTQAARLTHYRIPPGGSECEPLALEIEAIVVQGDSEHGEYLLLAQLDELNHAKVLLSAVA